MNIHICYIYIERNEGQPIQIVVGGVKLLGREREMQLHFHNFGEMNFVRKTVFSCVQSSSLHFLLCHRHQFIHNFFSPFAPHSQLIHLPCTLCTRRSWRISLLPSEQYPQHQCIYWWESESASFTKMTNENTKIVRERYSKWMH